MIRSAESYLKSYPLYLPYFCAYLTNYHFLVAPVKILSKKEQKRLEDLEFERLMNEVGPADGQEAAQTQPEETKQSAETTAADEKKRLANQKKKEKKKAAAAAAAEAKAAA